jgi:orotate phosphoribosyltransferase
MFYYDVFPETRALLDSLGIRLHYLATWNDILTEARASGYLAPPAAAEMERFIREPARWSLAHGGIDAFPAG